ncbi:MAG: hypothetical protein HY897_02770 [Deltaproteobacteria bacterium]|nr:hypothetical protein [Deltaproteobacteria bacterium]
MTDEKREFRRAASFGKRQEFIAVGELLRRGFDVYMTLVDDQQIDCIIRQERGRRLRYLDIQIKARSRDCDPRNGALFAGMQILKPRKDYFFIFYSEPADTYWVMPSLAVVKAASRNREGKHVGKYTLHLGRLTGEGLAPLPKFKSYEGAFQLLELRPER